jgi:hypothetical protein
LSSDFEAGEADATPAQRVAKLAMFSTDARKISSPSFHFRIYIEFFSRFGAVPNKNYIGADRIAWPNRV